MLFYMAYLNQLLIGYTMYKTAQLDSKLRTYNTSSS